MEDFRQWTWAASRERWVQESIGKPPHEELDHKVHPYCHRNPSSLPPPGYQHALPGTVLRSRDVEVAFSGLIRLRATATQLLYRTMDMNSKPEAAVTTVMVLAGMAPGQTSPLLSYQSAIDAVTSRCFPSYALQQRTKAISSAAVHFGGKRRKGLSVSVPTRRPTGCGAHRLTRYCVSRSPGCLSSAHRCPRGWRPHLILRPGPAHGWQARHEPVDLGVV